MAMAAIAMMAPATPTPMPALAPVVRPDGGGGVGAGVGVVEVVGMVWVVLLRECICEVVVLCVVGEVSEVVVGALVDDVDGLPEMDTGGGVTLSRCAQPSVEGSGVEPGNKI